MNYNTFPAKLVSDFSAAKERIYYFNINTINKQRIKIGKYDFGFTFSFTGKIICWYFSGLMKIVDVTLYMYFYFLSVFIYMNHNHLPILVFIRCLKFTVREKVTVRTDTEI